MPTGGTAAARPSDATPAPGHDPEAPGDALTLMAEAAEAFRARLLAAPLCRRLDVPTIAGVPARLEWSNTLLAAPGFRRAHVETLHMPGRLCVLHVCLFAPTDDPAPIFGFDMIAGPARVTGIFLDLSPVVADRRGLRLTDVVDPGLLAGFAEKRVLPPWGEVFSPEMLAIRPLDLAEVARALALAQTALTGWLERPAAPWPPAPAAIAAGQTRYIDGQRRNEHTLRMLAGFIGAAPARCFIDEILFPPVPAPTAALAA